METRLLDSIVCPKCYGKLEYDKTHDQLICHHDKLIYPVKEGIPVLLESDATKIPQADTDNSI